MRSTPWKFPRGGQSCGNTVWTAKTTLLPANDSLGIKKDLNSSERLDDRLDPLQTFNSLCHVFRSIFLVTVAPALYRGVHKIWRNLW